MGKQSSGRSSGGACLQEPDSSCASKDIDTSTEHKLHYEINEALFNYAGKFRYKVKLGNLWENEEITQAILKANCIPAGMELFPVSNKSQWDFIKK